jgi:hypothetical protein
MALGLEVYHKDSGREGCDRGHSPSCVDILIFHIEITQFLE